MHFVLPHATTTNISATDSSYALHWSLNQVVVDSKQFCETLDYKLAAQNLQPHKNLLAADLYEKIMSETKDVKTYVNTFEKAIQQFKKEDSLIYEMTKSLLIKHTPIFEDVPEQATMSFTRDSGTNSLGLASLSTAATLNLSNSISQNDSQLGYAQINHDIVPELIIISDNSIIEELPQLPNSMATDLNESIVEEITSEQFKLAVNKGSAPYQVMESEVIVLDSSFESNSTNSKVLSAQQINSGNSFQLSFSLSDNYYNFSLWDNFLTEDTFAKVTKEVINPKNQESFMNSKGSECEAEDFYPDYLN